MGRKKNKAKSDYIKRMKKESRTRLTTALPIPMNKRPVSRGGVIDREVAEVYVGRERGWPLYRTDPDGLDPGSVTQYKLPRTMRMTEAVRYIRDMEATESYDGDG